MSIKKNLESSRLVDEKITKNYQQEFRNISLQLIFSVYLLMIGMMFIRKIVFWELELSQSRDNSIDEIISMQKSEANSQFFRFIKNNYKELD